jgi:hypothetical protein
MGADPGASHARKGRPTPETRDLLAEAHATLRDELRDTLRELRPAATPPPGLGLGDPAPIRPTLADRDRLVGLIGKLMTLLGTEITPAPATRDALPAAVQRPRRRARIDYG